MKKVVKLITIGIIAGVVLMALLKLVLVVTGNIAYTLLFNFEYIPFVESLKPTWFFGYVFHFLTCIVSVFALFYILKTWSIEKRILPYVIVYTIGGAALFFLTSLSEKPPKPTDFMAWFYWTIGHAVFAYIIGVLVKKWL